MDVLFVQFVQGNAQFKWCLFLFFFLSVCGSVYTLSFFKQTVKSLDAKIPYSTQFKLKHVC